MLGLSGTDPGPGVGCCCTEVGSKVCRVFLELGSLGTIEIGSSASKSVWILGTVGLKRATPPLLLHMEGTKKEEELGANSVRKDVVTGMLKLPTVSPSDEAGIGVGDGAKGSASTMLLMRKLRSNSHGNNSNLSYKEVPRST